MDFWQVLMIGFRRWMVTVPLVLVGLIFAWTYSSGVKPTYSAEASLLYLPPAVDVNVQTFDPALEDPQEAVDIETETAQNPYASSLRAAALAGELYINSDSVRSQIADEGFSPSYAVSTDRRNPVLYLTVDAGGAPSAVDTVGRLIDEAESDLRARQLALELDEREFVSLDVVTQDASAAVDFGSRTRVRAILVLVAFAFAFGVAVLVEAFLDHRQGRPPFSRGALGSGPGSGDDAGGQALTISIPAGLVHELGGAVLVPEDQAEPRRIRRAEVVNLEGRSSAGGDRPADGDLTEGSSDAAADSRWSRRPGTAAADGA